MNDSSLKGLCYTVLLAKYEGQGKGLDEPIYQSLEGHTLDALKVYRHLLEQRAISYFCDKWALDPGILCRNAFLVIALHDVGKGIGKFQERIRQGKHSTAWPHAFFGLPIIVSVFKQAGLTHVMQDVYPEVPVVESLCLVAHHSQLHSEIYQELQSDLVAPYSEEIWGFLPQVSRYYQDLGFDRWFHLDAKVLPEVADSVAGFLRRPLPAGNILSLLGRLRQLSDQAPPAVGSGEGRLRLKAVYSFMLSLLKFSDHWSSAYFSGRASEGLISEEQCSRDDDRRLVAGSILGELELSSLPHLDLAQVMTGESPYPYQEMAARSSHRWLVINAPCGRGKTKSALLWFLSQRQKREEGQGAEANGNSVEGPDRLIMAMPTQVTSNAMRSTLAQIFGSENVGVYHGRSLLELKEAHKLLADQARREVLLEGGESFDQAVPEEGLSQDMLKHENFLSSVYAKPVIVTTVDHLLYSFLHGFPQADYALGNLQTAAIVFDEVHYYDRTMLSHLRELFRVLRAMQIPHLLMSGTLSPVLLGECGVQDYPVIADADGSKFHPFKITKREEPLVREGTSLSQSAAEADAEGETEDKVPLVLEANPKIVTEVVENYYAGMTQFIILNTVRKAQVFYQALVNQVPPNDCILLHSRFTYFDRRQKERYVLKRLRDPERRPLILVSTQVIEVSLDISCDRMYTELAPIDALGQRGGRLHRGGREPDSYQLVICRPENLLPYKQVEDIVLRTWELLPGGGGGEAAVSYGEIQELCQQAYETLRLPPSNFAELLRRSTLFGLRAEDVRWSEEEGKVFRPRDTNPTVDVIPDSLFQAMGEEALAAEYLVSVPVWWLINSRNRNLDLFYPYQRQGSKSQYYFLVCKVRYDRDVGFHELEMDKPAGVIID